MPIGRPMPEFSAPFINVVSGRWTVTESKDEEVVMREFSTRDAAAAWIDERRATSDEERQR